MRYKFRAWDRERNEMRDIKLMDWSDWWVSTGSTWERDKSSEYGERNSFSNEETDRHVLMQYTGLHDRNGKEIYEGDIVRESEECWGIVVFDENANYSVFMHNVGPNEPLIDFTNDSIVIGNIYENPGLLGGTTDARLPL